MKQSHGTSFIKSISSTAVGFGVSFVAQLVFLPMLGVQIELHQNAIFAIIMTVISVARGYIMERVFEALGWRTRMSAFAMAVLAERQRQILVEGWSSYHDDDHDAGVLARAGACYALYPNRDAHGSPPIEWPWNVDWWKPVEFRRSLVKSAALIIAEGERHDRNRNRKRKVAA